MNQRESSGLPLRAMVMVLLFLGVVFLLVALQAVGSDDASTASDSPAITSVTSTPATTTTSSAAPVAKADVRVFNISEVAGAAENTANKLRDAKWNVTETGNLVLENVPSTTVYYGDTPGERQAAEAVGKLLGAAVDKRRPELVEQPPGVIVAVTG